MPLAPGPTNFTPNSRVVSPGVFSREIDQSGIAQGVAEIGGVIVAPFSRGPGFSPTTCNTVAELEQRFGTADGTLYGPYTAKQYLQEKGFVTVVRVGALTGYHQKYPWFIWAEEGKWERVIESGWTNPTASFISPDGVYFRSASNGINTPMFLSSSVVYSGTPSHSVTQSFWHLVTGSRNASVVLSSSIVISSSVSMSYPATNTTRSNQIFTQSLWYGSDFTGSLVFPYLPIQVKLMPTKWRSMLFINCRI